MKGLVLPWNPPCFFSPPSLHSLSFFFQKSKTFNLSISATLESTETQQQQLKGKERRRLRNERRENNTTNWREEVEMRLIKKPKKEKKSWMEDLNLDNLMKLGPQWWVVRVSRVRGQDTAERLARSLARNFPDMDFKIYAPAVHVKKKLKDGSYSTKPKPLFPGCIFLRCLLNKPLHDFIVEYDGTGGFVGFKVGNTKRMISRPKPVSVKDMEAIFKQAKEEQEKTVREFEEEEKNAALKSGIPITELEADVSNAVVDSKPKRGSRKTSKQVTVKDTSPAKINYKLFVPGSTVQIVSGSFSGFSGTLKKLNRKTKLATVHFTIFGKENIVDLDVSEIALETN